MNSDSSQTPVFHSYRTQDDRELRTHIENVTLEIQGAINATFGSLFRAGSQMSFFAMQTQRYADLYSPNHLNLLSYPFFYEFRSPETRMPHEIE